MSFAPFFVTVSLILGLDVLTKTLVREKLPLGAEIHLLPFFSLVHVKNTGIAFGMFQQMNFFFIFLGLAVAGGIFYYGIRLYKEDPFAGVVLAGVLGGAMGNLADRVFFGNVTDFLDFYVGVHHWPAFNVADSAICVGAGLLIVQSFRTPKS